MKKQPKTYLFYMGIIVFVISILLKVLMPDAEGPLEALPYVLSGFGSGIIGVGVVSIIRKRKIKQNPEKAKLYEIAEKDERNIKLREKAGYASWHITLFLLAILSMAFVIFDYKMACWLTIGALFIHVISLFIFIAIYDKKL